jgi:hypothetical protein
MNGGTTTNATSSTTGGYNNPFSALNLSSTQTSEIASILSTAKISTTLPADVQSQINQVLTTAQQQSLSAEYNNGFEQSSAVGNYASNVQQQILAADALNVNQLQAELNS